MKSGTLPGTFRITVSGMLAASLLAFAIRSIVAAASPPLCLGLISLINWIIRRSRVDVYPISIDVRTWEMPVAQLVAGAILLLIAVGIAYWLHRAGTPTKALPEQR